MVAGEWSSSEMAVKRLGAVSSRSTASHTQSPAQEERGSGGGPNGTGPAVSSGQTAAGTCGEADRSGNFGRRKKEKKEKEKRRKGRARAVSPYPVHQLYSTKINPLQVLPLFYQLKNFTI
ncbi:hypothetical protein ACLB2K_026369 [Fragaria x ananassa]